MSRFNGQNRAVAVMLENNRYFCGLGKNGRVMTAWSLAGSKLFIDDSHQLRSDCELLTKKGKKYSLCYVVMVS